MTQPTPAPRTTTDFFDDEGGSQAPSFKWNGQIGDWISGEIVDQFATVVKEPGKDGKVKTYSDGRPQPQLNVTLQTQHRNWERVGKDQATGELRVPKDPTTGKPLPASEDTGLRRIYVKHDMKSAVGKAYALAKGEGGLQTGGTLSVKLIGFKPTDNVNPMPLYEARYVAPSASASFVADETPAAQPAPAPAAPAAPATNLDEPPF